MLSATKTTKIRSVAITLVVLQLSYFGKEIPS